MNIPGGESSYRGLSHDYVLVEVGKFVCQMHDAGIIHRDLSAGNILLVPDGDKAKPYMIDIGRAKVKSRLSHRERLIDVMRICYKLSWSSRERFVASYCEQMGGTDLPGWRQAVKYYWLKQYLKKKLKAKLKFN